MWNCDDNDDNDERQWSDIAGASSSNIVCDLKQWAAVLERVEAPACTTVHNSGSATTTLAVTYNVISCKIASQHRSSGIAIDYRTCEIAIDNIACTHTSIDSFWFEKWLVAARNWYDLVRVRYAFIGSSAYSQKYMGFSGNKNYDLILPVIAWGYLFTPISLYFIRNFKS